MTKLLKDGTVTNDPWIHVADGDAVPESGPVIVTLARWQVWAFVWKAASRRK